MIYSQVVICLEVLMKPIYAEDGTPMQFIDGQIYTPANEKYIIRLFGYKHQSAEDFTFHIQN